MSGDGREQKERVKTQFGKNAWKYVKSESHSKGTDLDTLVEWLSPAPEWVCLDIATGGGHVAKRLASKAGVVVASDLTMNMLKAARDSMAGSGYENVFFVLADSESLPFLDSTFDAVTCRIAPHHFSNKESFVSESCRVMKTGGKFLMVDNVTPEERTLADFMNSFEYTRDPSHVSCGSPAEWEKMITSNGMDILDMSIRKKTYEFRTWVERTAESSLQIENTENIILSASDELKEYFRVKVENSHVVSLQIDEMMVMAVKDQ